MSNRHMDPVETFRVDDPDTDVVTGTRRLVAYHNRVARRTEKGDVAPSPRNPDKQGNAFNTTLAIIGASAVLALLAGGEERVSEFINGSPAGGANPAMTSNPNGHNPAPKPNGLTIDGPTGSLPPQDTLPPTPGH